MNLLSVYWDALNTNVINMDVFVKDHNFFGELELRLHALQKKKKSNAAFDRSL